MILAEVSWWNILWLKTYTTLGYIVSQAKHVSQVQKDLWNNITKSCVYLQFIRYLYKCVREWITVDK